MGAIVILLIIIGLIVLGLQRNHARQRDANRRSLAGSGNVTDRDAERVVVDLEAARSRRNFRRPARVAAGGRHRRTAHLAGQG
ncbi:MAG TPA: hypothetical protein VHV49_03620 [Pseudonocardiaceae bacterium]|jgi:hypothetical protein|nr:hypothetical protein [Pseudonocardiaceae bacterium]